MTKLQSTQACPEDMLVFASSTSIQRLTVVQYQRMFGIKQMFESVDYYLRLNPETHG